MNIVRPIEIVDANLTATTAPETEHPIYVAGTTYAVGDKVIVVATHKAYESLIATNLGNYPPDNLIGVEPAWLDIGATNAWRMFDTQVGTLTEAQDSFSVSVDLGVLANSIALLNMEVAKIGITITEPTEGVVYSKEIDMVSNSGIINLYDYFFQPIVRDRDLVKLDLPAFPKATVKIDFSGTGTVSCGMMVIGNKKTIGTTKWEPRISILDYSRKEVDAFGNPTLVVRKSARLLSCDLSIPTNYVSEAQRILTDQRATPAVWVGHPDYHSTILYGFYRSFSIILSNFSTSDCSLDLEGLV